MYYHSINEVLRDLRDYGHTEGNFFGHNIEIDFDDVCNIAYMYIYSQGGIDEVEFSNVEDLEDALYYMMEE